MRRTALICFAGLALAGSGTARAQTAPPPAVPPTPLAAATDSCQTGPLATDRHAVFSASMPAVRGAVKLWLRFDLYSRPLDGKAWKKLKVPKWGVWQKSRANVPGFIAAKRVDGLEAPAQYRATIEFRWYDKRGKRIRSAKKTTATCEQPDLRPDLTAERLTAVDLGGGTYRYTVSVLNEGKGDARAFAIVPRLDGTDLAPVAIDALPAGESRAVSFEGPACTASSRFLVSVDPENVVDESSETDNAPLLACPTLNASP